MQTRRRRFYRRLVYSPATDPPDHPRSPPPSHPPPPRAPSSPHNTDARLLRFYRNACSRYARTDGQTAGRIGQPGAASKRYLPPGHARCLHDNYNNNNIIFNIVFIQNIRSRAHNTFPGTAIVPCSCPDSRPRVRWLRLGVPVLFPTPSSHRYCCLLFTSTVVTRHALHTLTYAFASFINHTNNRVRFWNIVHRRVVPKSM